MRSEVFRSEKWVKILDVGSEILFSHPISHIYTHIPLPITSHLTSKYPTTIQKG